MNTLPRNDTMRGHRLHAPHYRDVVIHGVCFSGVPAAPSASFDDKRVVGFPWLLWPGQRAPGHTGGVHT